MPNNLTDFSNDYLLNDNFLLNHAEKFTSNQSLPISNFSNVANSDCTSESLNQPSGYFPDCSPTTSISSGFFFQVPPSTTKIMPQDYHDSKNMTNNFNSTQNIHQEFWKNTDLMKPKYQVNPFF